MTLGGREKSKRDVGATRLYDSGRGVALHAKADIAYVSCDSGGWIWPFVALAPRAQSTIWRGMSGG